LRQNSRFVAKKVRTHLVQFYCNFIDIILAFWAILGFEPARGTVLAQKQVLLFKKFTDFKRSLFLFSKHKTKYNL